MSSQITNICVPGCFECAAGSHLVNYSENEVEIPSTPGELHILIPSIFITFAPPMTHSPCHPSPYCPSAMDCVMCYLDSSVPDTNDEHLLPSTSPEDIQDNHPWLFRSHSRLAYYDDPDSDSHEPMDSDDEQESDFDTYHHLADNEAGFNADDSTDEGYYSDDESVSSFDSNDSSDSTSDDEEWPLPPPFQLRPWVPVLTGDCRKFPTIICPEGSNCFACLTMRLNREEFIEPECSGTSCCVCTDCYETTVKWVEEDDESWFGHHLLGIFSEDTIEDSLSEVISGFEQHMRECAELDAKIAEERKWLLEQGIEV